MNCEKLKSFFEDNPRDLQSLRQDKALHTVKLPSHLKDVPDYMIPNSLKNIVNIRPRKRKFNRETSVSTAAKSKFQARASNPLIAMSLGKNKKRKK